MDLKNLYVTLPVGQSVRDYLISGFLSRLLDRLPNFRIIALTPSYKVPEFLDLCPKHDRFLVRRMELPVFTQNARLISFRRKFRNRTIIRKFLTWESRKVELPEYLKPTFEEFPPSLVISTHPLTSYDYDVVMWARRLKVQTMGIVKSWDNVGKGLKTPTHVLSVWNPVNQQEAQWLLGYREEEVEINGGVGFDAYYDPDYYRSREEFLGSLNFDPSRPLITYATSGDMDKGFWGRDETHLAEDLLHMIKNSKVLKGAQLVIRLHPQTRLECFWKYLKQSGIKVSFTSYMPGLQWCPNRANLEEHINLLRHSDAIVTPGSSWTLEAAIFDTPTVVSAYSDWQPDHAAADAQWAFDRHFKPILNNEWVPITYSFAETQKAIEEAFLLPSKHVNGRKSIVENYIYHRDRYSSRRVMDWIAKSAENLHPGAPQGL